MTISTHQAAINVLAEDIRTAHEILDYSRRNPQVAYMLGRAGTQSHLFGLARTLAEAFPVWSNQASITRSQILGGLNRAIHALSDPAGCMFFQYELKFYSALELSEIDPPRPQATAPQDE